MEVVLRFWKKGPCCEVIFVIKENNSLRRGSRVMALGIKGHAIILKSKCLPTITAVPYWFPREPNTITLRTSKKLSFKANNTSIINIMTDKVNVWQSVLLSFIVLNLIQTCWNTLSHRVFSRRTGRSKSQKHEQKIYIIVVITQFIY